MRRLLLISLFIPFFLIYGYAQAVTYICPENKIFDMQITKSGSWLINGRKSSYETNNEVTLNIGGAKYVYFKSCSKGFYVKALRKSISGKTNGYCNALEVGSQSWTKSSWYKQVCYLSPKINSPLYKAFNSINDRKLIQSTLKSYQLYSGKIDGLYGPKTRSALESYAKSLGKEDHLKSEKLAKELLQILINSSELRNTDGKTKKGLF